MSFYPFVICDKQILPIIKGRIIADKKPRYPINKEKEIHKIPASKRDLFIFILLSKCMTFFNSINFMDFKNIGKVWLMIHTFKICFLKCFVFTKKNWKIITIFLN